MRPDLSVVIPLKDEQEVVEVLHTRLAAVLDDLPLSSEILFVDDGSVDDTPRLLRALRRRDLRVRVLRLSRNFGHQAAVTAGLDHVRGRAVVVMDGDLQDPPELIPQLVHAWHAGSDVVYAVRRSRAGPLWRRLAYAAFYRSLRLLADLDIPLDSGDFCLMDRRVVRALRRLPERVRFVRGLRRFVGFRQTGVAFDRPDRAAGRPKYTLRKLFALARDGVVGFSSKPLRLATWLGLAGALVAVALSVWVVHDALAARTAPQGWASLMIVVLFLGSVQLLCLGILGEYLRQIFLEVKGRPTYILLDDVPRSTPRRSVTPRRTRGTDDRDMVKRQSVAGHGRITLD